MKITLPAYFILLFIVLFAATARAQSKETYRIGLSANLPFIPEHQDSFSTRTGWGLWINGEYEMKNTARWTVRPGLAYNSYGYDQNYHNAAGAAITRKINEHYFDISALFAFKVSHEANSVRLMAGAGASLFLSRSTDQPDLKGYNITQKTLDDKKSGNIYLLVNAGLSLPLSNHIDLGILYSHGLPHKVYPLDVTGRLSMVQLQVGYKFEKGPKTAIIKYKSSLADEDEEAELPYKRDSLVLLVRLSENLTRINLLKQQGEAAEAERERQYAEDENRKVIEAFKKEFKLFPVLFFYDTDSKTALKGEFKGLFVNELLQRDSTIELPQRQYFFAEFGRQFDEVSQTSGMFGFVIYDDKFRQVPPPFPSFTSDKYGILNKQEVIARVNKKLKKYFSGNKK